MFTIQGRLFACLKRSYKIFNTDVSFFVSEKRRSPAWCDRVLRYKNPLRLQDADWVKQELYTSCAALQSSDHKPVVSLYKLKVSLVIYRRGFTF